MIVFPSFPVKENPKNIFSILPTLFGENQNPFDPKPIRNKFAEYEQQLSIHNLPSAAVVTLTIKKILKR